MEAKGGCRCGAVSYTMVGEPKFQIHCQCNHCQKMTGAGHASIMIFSDEGFQLEGTPATFSYDADSNNTVTHHFCSECGAPLFNRNSQYSRAVYIMVGSMDDPSFFKPERVVYASSGQEWDKMDPALPSFEGMPTRR